MTQFTVINYKKNKRRSKSKIIHPSPKVPRKTHNLVFMFSESGFYIFVRCYTGGELQVFHLVRRLLLMATLCLSKKLIFAVLYVFFFF